MANSVLSLGTQTVPGATQSPPDLIEDEVSDPESALSDSEPEGM